MVRLRRTGIHSTAVVGDPPEMREWIVDNAKPYLLPDIDPSARLNAYVTVDSGCERATRVGGMTLLMAHVHIGHDAVVGAGCELAPGVVICGHAEIGHGVRIGVNACVLPYKQVGAGARIGAGAVVTRNVPPGEVWAGNPARRLAIDGVLDAA